MLAIYIAHSGLLQLGHWQDEFLIFTRYRSSSFAAVVHRVITWSPRPFSESLIYLYFVLSEHAGRPLFAEVLTFTWVLLTVPACVYILRARTNPVSGNDLALKSYVAISVPVLCILNAPLNEMFLWPMGALAYVPGATSVMALLFVTANDSGFARRTWITLCCCGVLGSFSVEVASVVCGIFFSLSLLSLLVWHDGRNEATGGQAAIMSCLVPILSTLLVFILLKTHRAESGSPLSENLEYVHHGWRSFTAAIPIFLRSLVGSYASGYQATAVFRNAVSSVCYLAGMIALADVFASAKSALQTRAFAALAIACFAGSFISVFATLYQFGVMCCERHDSFRDCLQIIGLASLALWIARGPLKSFHPPDRLRGMTPLVGVSLIAAACLFATA